MSEVRHKVGADLNFISESSQGDFVSDLLNETLFDPIQEFLARPKKGVRSELVRIGAQWTGENRLSDRDIDNIALVLEVLHSGSLIIDDIQDGSKVRRNRPAFHCEHGVPKALNAGNYLYFWAIHQIQKTNVETHLKALLSQKIVETLLEGHVGQALDVGCDASRVPMEEMPGLVSKTIDHKTGALMSLGMVLGGTASGLATKTLNRMDSVGRELGFLLQAYDDLKNYKFSSNGKPSAMELKKFEDFKNRSPGYIWKFAAEETGFKEYTSLQQAAREYPQLDSLRDWVERNEFHQKSIESLKLKTTSLRKSLEIDYDCKQVSWESIETIMNLLERIEGAYERA